MRARPGLIARLIIAPREAIHSIGAYLHLAPDAARSDIEVAATIDEKHPRDLLRAALPDRPPRLHRALDRAGNRAHDSRFYARPGILCRDIFADALLNGESIDEARLSRFELLSKMDRALARSPAVIQGSTYMAEAADCIIALLRARDALRDSDLHVPQKAGTAALGRRLRTALGRIEAPDQGSIAPAPFRLVRSSDELQQVGRALANCVAFPEWIAARRQIQLVQGSTVFRAADRPPLLASLVRVADRVWNLEQLCGPRNAAPPPGTRTALVRDLTAAGQKIVTTDPQSALGRLTQEGNRRCGVVEDNLEDEDGKAEGGIAA